MEFYLVVAIISIVVMSILGYLIGNRGKQSYLESIGKLENNIANLTKKITEQESLISERGNVISTLTADRDVQKANAENYSHQLISQKGDYEKRIIDLKAEADKILQNELARGQKQLNEQKASSQKLIDDQKKSYEDQLREQKTTSFLFQYPQLKE
ncbi:MAG: hypothetical protein II100_01320 [Prevotella sp.]|nr:hypothetical protein [Prevotella sp.]